jgi:hypothetical protein
METGGGVLRVAGWAGFAQVAPVGRPTLFFFKTFFPFYYLFSTMLFNKKI